MTSSTEHIRKIEADIEDTRADLDETLDLLFAKLSPANLLDDVIERTQDKTSALAGRVGHMLWRKPFTATLVSVGVGLFKRRKDRAALNGEGEQNIRGKFKRKVHDMEDRMAEKARRSKTRIEGERGRIREKGHELTERARETIESRSRQIHETAGELREQASDVATKGKEYIEETTERLHEMSDQARARGRRYSRKARTEAGDLFMRQPLLAGALLVAVGAMMAAIIPPSRSERQVLGRPARKLRSRAAQLLNKGMKKGTHAASAALSSARETIESEGLGLPEGEDRPAVH